MDGRRKLIKVREVLLQTIQPAPAVTDTPSSATNIKGAKLCVVVFNEVDEYTDLLT
jgi:hypothetical protein